ncbi:DUF2235 domain-containing protein [Silicimonas algicola]|uniref:Uncharacterized protein (DUF2235 family) n=2 Tax=Silicimonas algicola TaxID=1826607 RepID=A0A316GAB2_9RHOB|nr:DUF2235 domain-containing protein [Silicimonas algicola]AZQ69648.1 DUF2235 domain-containing protein [Silicimonas algicola]PWK56946.1 uncharacterized protein (DUF2235 family) [Silicimonas algicola]
MGWGERLSGLLGFFRRTERSVQPHTRDPVDHVVLLDGTMSTLDEGAETNVGLIYKLLEEASRTRRLGLLYEAGTQWEDWSKTLDIIEGRGINRQIRRVYGWLASRYRPGDRIFLIGYSRGAYAARSLAGVIGQVGLLRPEQATERMVNEAWKHYQADTVSEVCAEFTREYCHDDTPIEVLGLFDTVKSLGFRAPFVWKWAEVKHSFHHHHLGRHVRRGYHALALDETREAFAPVLWDTPNEFDGEVEQVWFRGSHGDVGGQLAGFDPARPLSNIPLLWMLERLERCDLPLPSEWRSRIQIDPDAPSVGTWRGWGKFFLARKRRVVGADGSESIHPSALGRSRRARAVAADLNPAREAT